MTEKEKELPTIKEAYARLKRVSLTPQAQLEKSTFGRNQGLGRGQCRRFCTCCCHTNYVSEYCWGKFGKLEGVKQTCNNKSKYSSTPMIVPTSNTQRAHTTTSKITNQRTDPSNQQGHFAFHFEHMYEEDWMISSLFCQLPTLWLPILFLLPP